MTQDRMPFTSRNAWHFAVASAYPRHTTSIRVLCEARITDGAVVAEWDAATNTGWMRSIVVPQAVPATDGHAGYLGEGAAFTPPNLAVATAKPFPAKKVDGAWQTSPGKVFPGGNSFHREGAMVRSAPLRRDGKVVGVRREDSKYGGAGTTWVTVVVDAAGTREDWNSIDLRAATGWSWPDLDDGTQVARAPQ